KKEFFSRRIGIKDSLALITENDSLAVLCLQGHFLVETQINLAAFFGIDPLVLRFVSKLRFFALIEQSKCGEFLFKIDLFNIQRMNIAGIDWNLTICAFSNSRAKFAIFRFVNPT